MAEFLKRWRPARGRSLRVFTDGAIRPRFGCSGLAAVVRDDRGRIVDWWTRRAGALTNNEAEYAAVIMALEQLRSYQPAEVQVFSDSRLIVDQMHGVASARSVALRVLHARLAQLAAGYPRLSFHFIPRERNRLADALASEALEDGQP